MNMLMHILYITFISSKIVNLVYGLGGFSCACVTLHIIVAGYPTDK